MPIPGSNILNSKLLQSIQSSGRFIDPFTISRKGTTVDAEFNASAAWVPMDGTAGNPNLNGNGLWGVPSDTDLQVAAARSQIINASVVTPVAGIKPGDRMVIRNTTCIVVAGLRDRVWYKYLIREISAKAAA